MHTIISVEGHRGFANATDRIETELVKNFDCELGREPELLINLNGLFSKTEEFYNSRSNKPVRFYNLLDANNNQEGFYFETKKHLTEAEIATTISDVTRLQIERKTGLNRRLEIIGFPMQDVSFLGWQKSLEFIMVGRVYSGYKNLDLVYKTLDLLRVPRESLIVAGPEKPAFGLFLHNISVSELNDLYNSSRFTFCLSSWEGLGLSLIESVVTDTFPICLSSNPIIKELGLLEFATGPDPGAIATKINQIYTNQPYYRSILAELRPKYIEKFSLNAVCKKMMTLYTDYKQKV